MLVLATVEQKKNDDLFISVQLVRECRSKRRGLDQRRRYFKQGALTCKQSVDSSRLSAMPIFLAAAVVVGAVSAPFGQCKPFL